MATMPTTVVPFLYHTRTICRLTRASQRPFPGSISASAGLHSTTCCAAWQPRNHQPRYNQPRNNATRGRDGSLYTNKWIESESIPFELPPDVQVSDEEAEDISTQDTITPRERSTFKNIFLEIANRGEEPKRLKGNRDTSNSDTVQKAGSSRFLESLREKQREHDGRESVFSAIMQDAAERTTQARPASIPGLDVMSPLELMYSATDREQALLKFPPTLRKAARVAYGMVGGDPSLSVREEGGNRVPLAEAVSEREQTRVDPIDSVGLGAGAGLAQKLKIESDRRKERMRIRSQMDAAETDVELWDVMEREVFTLVRRLGLETEIEIKASKGKRANKSKASEQSSPLNPEIYGPIYPHLLFEGVQFLNTKFSRPSPYIFHVLPRVKELGLMSYVLGVSTSFYNQLMSIMWERYGDATGVLDLMEEMRHAGLYFDVQSQKIHRDISEVYIKADEGKLGMFCQKMMSMPEYQPLLLTRLHHWEKQIYSSIAHQMQSLR